MTSIDAMKQALDSQDFYEVCQQYRHSMLGAEEFEALKQWILQACAEQVEKQDELPGGWETRTVTGLDELVDALDYADRKGFLPDYIQPAWERFSYAAPPQRQPLTHQQVYDLEWPADVGGFDDVLSIVRQTERKHGIGGGE